MKTQFCYYVGRAVVSLLIIGQLVLPGHVYRKLITNRMMEGHHLVNIFPKYLDFQIHKFQHALYRVVFICRVPTVC